MALLSSSTTFTILAAEYYEEQLDLIVLPQTDGSEAMRELHYPGDVFPPIIYPDMPDRWENFDTVPLTAAPMTKAEMTLSGNKYSRWNGYMGDRPIKEYWRGDSQRRSRVNIEFFRRLVEYFFNPPTPPDYIIWCPKDRTSATYKVIIEDLSIGGQSVLAFEYPAIYWDEMPGEMVLTMRIIEEVVS